MEKIILQDEQDSSLPIYTTPRPQKKSRITCAIGWLCLTFLAFHTIQLWNSRITLTRNPAYLIEATHGAVATENKRCSDIGLNVLKEGGNAVDAAVAATFCIGVVNMFSSGLGGGGFMTVRIPLHDGSSEVYNIDFRETAPALANSTMFPPQSNSSRFGGLSVAVPGEVKGLEEAHRRWGLLPWKRLIQPSINLATGWEVDKELGRRLPWFAELMLGQPDWRHIFAPEGTLLQEGAIIRRTNYSRTLAAIAEGGSDVFYKGPIAESIVKTIQATGGIITLEDMANYSVIVKPALQGSFMGKKVYTTHAPTSGPVFIHMLNLIEAYGITERSGVNTHRMIEIFKFAFAARTRICDPAFQDEMWKIDEISTREFADLIRPNITDDRTHPLEYYNPEFDIIVDNGTSHTSVLDKNGMAVALTSTVNLVFASQVMDPETGVILNDEMDDFSVPGAPNGFGLYPSPYNYAAPYKRPLSSTVPTILEHADGTFFLSVGGSGGSMIFGAVFQTILNLMVYDLDISESIEYGRLHTQLLPNIVLADSIYPENLLDALRTRGHEIYVDSIDRVAAVVQAVLRQEDGKIFAASDSRKNGIAAGY